MLAGFSSYWWLLLLLFLLLWGGIRFVREKNSQQKQPLFFNNQNFSPFREHALLQVLLLLFGLLLLLVALWRPQWGEEIQKTEKKGLDIVFAVDVSKSMNALDFSRGNQLISRLDAVRYLVEEFTKTRPSDRLGLVEFAGESFVASPLTLDHTVFLNFLQGISDDDLGIQGTNLSEAIEVSLARLEVQAPDERGKAIVLFSDGEETLSSDAEKMAEVAKKRGIPIFTVGVGSENGMPIPEKVDAFGNIIYKRWQGELVLSKLNPEPLKKISDVTHGEYFHAEKFSDIEPLQEELETLPKKLLSQENISPKKEQYVPFAFVGLLLFLSGFFLPKRFFFRGHE